MSHNTQEAVEYPECLTELEVITDRKSRPISRMLTVARAFVSFSCLYGTATSQSDALPDQMHSVRTVNEYCASSNARLAIAFDCLTADSYTLSLDVYAAFYWA